MSNEISVALDNDQGVKELVDFVRRDYHLAKLEESTGLAQTNADLKAKAQADVRRLQDDLDHLKRVVERSLGSRAVSDGKNWIITVDATDWEQLRTLLDLPEQVA